jgi:radical SAM superfamily enzyme YgiQ (UPF0313 family)
VRPFDERLRAERGSRFREGGLPVVLLYPSPYRAGMSSLGYQSILGALQDAGFSPERAFLPDDEPAKPPLLTYETGSAVGGFPVVGISLAYELELAGLIRSLELAGIPPLRADRTPQHPKVLIGGPLTFSNPLPAAPFADAMILGEADDVAVPAFEAAVELDREAWLDVMEALPGGFVPERHGTALPAIAKASDATLPARSRILAPGAELSDMFLVEGERGCHRQCTFCVMRRSTNGGMRLASTDDIVDLIPADARRVGLVGAAISDHPDLVGLLQRIVDSGREVGVSSLRADRVALKPDIPRLLHKAGYRTLTVASDAASQRLRREIVKGTTEKHLLACAEAAREHGFRLLKVYMMVGLPGETDDDVEELVRFTNELARIHPTALGVAPFVPKKNTPLDTAAFAGIKVVEDRLQRITRGLRSPAEMRPTSARWAWAEYRLAQGGPEAGEAVLRAVRAGGSFAAWRRELENVPRGTEAPWRAAS